jgi:uncharacterized protein (DUF486 family)
LVVRTVILLLCSNIFMTFAWYGHLKYKHRPLVIVILVSWLIALPEYALQVPANRWGHGRFTGAQLKILQEAISIGVFLVFSIVYLREALTLRTVAAFVLVLVAVMLAVSGKSETSPSSGHPEPSQSLQSAGEIVGQGG